MAVRKIAINRKDIAMPRAGIEAALYEVNWVFFFNESGFFLLS